MKKINFIFYIIGIVCFLIAGYIVYDNFIKAEEEVIINKEDELNIINHKLSEIGNSLGWLVVVDGIDNQDSNGNYNISYGKNLLSDYEDRQLFTMEYILSNSVNFDKFVVLNTFDNSITDENPTDDFTIAYLNYDTFNEYYSSLFDDDFDLDKAKKGNTSYDNTHVYYENRRAGSNGVYVSMITCNNVNYEDGEYTSDVTITYSTRAGELIGTNEDYGNIVYTKDINGNIKLKSFILKDR